MYLSVIVPAYNEAERIPKTLLAMDVYLSKVNYPYEILVVNDGSRDNTADVVMKMAKIVKNLKLIDVKENHGKGSVVRDGMLAAKGDIRLFMDADNSTSVDQIEAMVPFFKEGYGVVVGSRAVKGAKLEPPEPFYRQLIGKALNLMVQVLLLPGSGIRNAASRHIPPRPPRRYLAFPRSRRGASMSKRLRSRRNLGIRSRKRRSIG